MKMAIKRVTLQKCLNSSENRQFSLYLWVNLLSDRVKNVFNRYTAEVIFDVSFEVAYRIPFGERKKERKIHMKLTYQLKLFVLKKKESGIKTNGFSMEIE